MWLSIVFIILLVAVAAAMFMQFRGRRGGLRNGGAGFVEGTLTLTGVSERPEADSKGQAYCTVSGTIVGPGTEPAEVYGTMVLAQDEQWPSIGSNHAVIYKPGKATTSWQFGQLPTQLDPGTPPM